MPVIKIVDWAKHYENNRTRELKKMAWVPMPNRHDGDGYTRLLDHVNGAAHFGAWCALVEVASRCDVRGTLVRNSGEAMEIDSLSRMTHIPAKIWKEVLPRLVNIGWIKIYEIPQDGAGLSQEDAPSPHLVAMEGNGMEGKEGNGKKEDSLSSSSELDPVNALLDEQKRVRDFIPFEKIVDVLNTEAGSKYNSKTAATRHFIKARWNEGYRFQDFECVIRTKCAQWKRDPKMVSFLRPQTLFGTKFESYLNEASIAAASIPCSECGARGGSHKYDCSHSITAREERAKKPEPVAFPEASA